MGNIFPDIKPSGLIQKHEATLIYQLVAALKGICAKLDDDGTVSGTTFEANCYTAIMNGSWEDYAGNVLINQVAEENFYSISPRGISDAARLQFLYNFFNAWETLGEQLDADGGVADTDYEANCYTALLLHMVEDTKGNTLGNGNTFWFRPGGVMNQKELVECYYNIVNAIETLTEQLDADGTVTDTNYEALWFTATVLKKIENAAGSVVGN